MQIVNAEPDRQAGEEQRWRRYDDPDGARRRRTAPAYFGAVPLVDGLAAIVLTFFALGLRASLFDFCSAISLLPQKGLTTTSTTMMIVANAGTSFKRRSVLLAYGRSPRANLPAADTAQP